MSTGISLGSGMPTFRYNKLVRDNIWQWHVESGHAPKGTQLTGEELRVAIATKLHEEADEVSDAKTREELVEEIADVQQLLDDLCASQGILLEELRDIQQKKREKKGGFLKGYFIETVTMPNEDDKWVAYCRAASEKYPEIDETTGHVNPVLPKLELGTYIHVKSGKKYEVTGVTFHTETNEPLVLYKPLYDSKYEIFARPYDMFTGEAQVNGETRHRFEKV